MMKLFIDTWGWFALGNKKDPYYDNTVKIYKSYRSKMGYIFTTDYVLDETITLLFRRIPYTEANAFIEKILKAAEQKYLILQPITQIHFNEAWYLRKKYRDRREISFTDFTSFVVMNEFSISDVLTGDAHFEQTGFGFKILPED